MKTLELFLPKRERKSSHEVPYAPPTLIYWNMRNTNGFPCSTTRENVIMVSGYSIDVLNSVFSKGPDALKKMKPWMLFQ